MTFGVDKEFRPQGVGTESVSTHNTTAYPDYISVAQESTRSAHAKGVAKHHPINFTDDPTAVAHFHNCYAVLVRGKRVRRHLYLNLPGAIKAMERAQARGDQADLVLLKMISVDGRELHLKAGDAQ